MFDLLRELRLKDKLIPSRNPEGSWCCIFLPALIGYFMLLTKLLNTKPAIGSFEIVQPSFQKLLYPDVKSMELIASGMLWTEGPLYIDDENAGIKYLLYSDTRENRIYRWEEGKGFFTEAEVADFRWHCAKATLTSLAQHLGLADSPRWWLEGARTEHDRHLSP